VNEFAPTFKCQKCGRPVGGSREDGGPWKPGDCHVCVYLPKMRADVARRRAFGHVVAGVDLDKAFAAYRKLSPFVGNLGKVKLEVAHRMTGGTRGTAYTSRRKLRVAVGPDATPERVLEVLVHEMCHLALPGDVGHGERFRLTFRRACSELWGIDVPLDAPPVNGVVAYGMGQVATEKLHERIARGEIALFPPDSRVEAPKPSRAELSVKLVEKRASHAVKMMTRAEKRAKAAQRTLAKWRKKVRYYERQAAKTGAPAPSTEK
jgi:SprT-like family protein